MRTAAALGLGLIAFVVLATANSGGYRYGVSDQAYYLPAVEQHTSADLFPRDRPLIETQAHLMAVDEIEAWLVTAMGLDLPAVSLALYTITLAVLFAAGVALARRLGLSWWGVAAFTLLLTFRHRIPKTGANSLEGYAHPRQLAFGLGLAAFAAMLGARPLLAGFALALAAMLHPTTAVWFGIVAGSMLLLRKDWPRGDERRVRSRAIWPALAAATALALAGVAGFRDRLTAMDPAWLAVLGEKDYLFPTGWPISAWLMNLLYVAVILGTLRARQARGLAVPREAALVGGLAVLFGLFVLSLPFSASHIALAVQLQVTRVFWIFDAIAMAYVAWWLTAFARPRVALLAVGVLAVASLTRGYYLLEVAQPERRLLAAGLPDTPWIQTLSWLREQPANWHVLADPGHAWKYGVSVRVGARKDTVLESVKDSALAIYDSNIARRVAHRAGLIGDFDALTAEHVLALDRELGLDVVILERPRELALPVLFQNARFTVYDLR